MVDIVNHQYDHVTDGDKDPRKAPAGRGGFRPIWFVAASVSRSRAKAMFVDVLGGIMERIPVVNVPFRRFITFIHL